MLNISFFPASSSVVPDDNPIDALDIEEQGQQKQQVNDNLSEQVDDIDDATENENLQPSSQPENSIDDEQEASIFMRSNGYYGILFFL